MGQHDDVAVSTQGKGQDTANPACRFLAQLLHSEHGLLMGQPRKVSDRMLVRASQTGAATIARSCVGPAAVSKQAGMTAQRNDLFPVEEMEVRDLRTEGLDRGVHLIQ